MKSCPRSPCAAEGVGSSRLSERDVLSENDVALASVTCGVWHPQRGVVTTPTLGVLPVVAFGRQRSDRSG
jgi:hypothetical protein